MSTGHRFARVMLCVLRNVFGACWQHAFSSYLATFCCVIPCILMFDLPLAQANEALPDYYDSPGLDSSRAVVGGAFGDSIDPFSGALQLHLAPISIPLTGGLSIDVILHYRANTVVAGMLAKDATPFGVGWDLHMGRLLLPPSGAPICGLY